MKWSGSHYVRTAAPFLLLALGACSAQPTADLPQDSELGLPLATVDGRLRAACVQSGIGLVTE